jgi:copper resistance protein B
MRALLLLAGTAPLALAAPTTAQDHSGHDMPGMSMPAPQVEPVSKAQPDPHAGHATQGIPATDAQADPHAGHDMGTMVGAMPHGQGGTSLPAGDAPAPAAPEPNYADRVYSPQEMAAARRQLRAEHGGSLFHQINFDLAEVQIRNGRDGYRWNGEAWFGGDIDRLTIKTEGDGDFGRRVGDAEIQALYSRAIGPYFNLQAGLRHDFEPGPSRTYATVGFEGLAPYWFNVEGALFVSYEGDMLARLEGYYDQRLTQRLILQPRAELDFAAQDVPENGIGSGLGDAELGLRLRYEIKREFAPYVGVSWQRKFGDTARFARAEGGGVEETSLVFGIRTWF